MDIALAYMTEEEVSRCVPPGEESSFGSLSTGLGHLPLKAMDIQATLEGLLAEVDLSQTFVNTFAEPLEAAYVFPLPDRAAVTRFRLDVGDRVVEGVLQERGAARRTYDQAITAGHRAAIAEEDRPGVFTLRVGNIPPGESARIRLSLSSPLIFDAGEVTFRFPLVVAPRYTPGQPLTGPNVGDGTACDTDAVPDASRITPPVLLPGYPNPVRLSLTVDVLPTQLMPHDFRCSLHSVFLQRDDLGRHRFQLQPGERLNRDFILRYQLGSEAVQTSLQLVPDVGDPRQGTYLLTLLPPFQPNRMVRPRDVVFVLDRSGSMAGWKMVAARRAVAHMVDSLTECDRFNVYAFDDRLETPPAFGTGLQPAITRNRSRALEFLWNIAARNGTEMAQPLDQAVNQLKSDRDRVLVLITDGQVGNEDQILRLLGKRLRGIRIFTLGIDQAVNEAFLKRLAGLGGGSCDVVESENRLDEVMYKVHRRIGSPTLSQIQVEMCGLETDADSLVPRRKLDLFAGTPVTLLGRYRGVPEGAALVRATDEAGRPWTQTVVGRCSHHPAAGVLWARGRIRELEDTYATGSTNPRELERTIIETSLRFHVLCRFTAYVAVDKSEVVNEGGQQHRVIQAVEAPAGWQMLPAAGASPRTRKAMFARPQALEELGDSELVLESKETTMLFPASAVPSPPAPPAVPPVPCALPSAAPPGGTPLSSRGIEGADVTADDMEARKSMRERRSAPSGLRKGMLRPEDDTEMPTTRPDAAANAAGAPVPPSQSDNEDSGEGFASQKVAFSDHAPVRGAIDRFFGSIFGRRKDKSNRETTTPSEADSMTAYRQRAKELLDELVLTGGRKLDERLRALGVLAVKLGELLEDMRSILPAKAIPADLKKLNADLEALLGQKQPDPADVEKAWKQAEETLRKFAEPGATI
jgi:Ca-activated chloride channel family protein